MPEDKRASEYLANERTFLAWIRTSIAVISVGFLITRVAPLAHSAAAGEPRSPKAFPVSFIVGIALMIFGAVIAILAVSRYQVINRAIEQGRVKADRGLVILVTILVVLLAAGMIALMLIVE